jgi:hypothetical protein
MNMKQGDRRQFVVHGNYLKSHHPNLANSVVFYDISILRVNNSFSKSLQNDLEWLNKFYFEDKEKY